MHTLYDTDAKALAQAILFRASPFESGQAADKAREFLQQRERKQLEMSDDAASVLRAAIDSIDRPS